MSPVSFANRRNSFRCRVHALGELRVGEQRWPVDVVDESAGGFAVLVCGPLDVQIGQTALLGVKGLWWRVSVANSAIADEFLGSKPPTSDELSASAPHEAKVQIPDATSADPNQKTEWLRLGLRRLDESAPPGAPLFRIPSLSNTLLDMAVRPRNPGLFTAVFVLLAAAVGAIVIAAILWWTDGPHAKRAGSVLGRLSQNLKTQPFVPKVNWSAGLDYQPLRGDFGKPEHAFRDSGVDHQQAFPDSRSAGGVKLPDWPSDLGRGGPSLEPLLAVADSMTLDDRVRRVARSLPGAAALTQPEVVEWLQLSPAQFQRIQQIVDAATDAIRELERLLASRSRREIAARREQILAAARFSALEQLTDEQRHRWSAIAGESNGAAAEQ